MTARINDMPSIQELVKRGWSIIYDDQTGDAVAIRSVIRQWKRLTWARRIYYRAKYGFDENGVLDIGLPSHKTTPDAPACFFRNPVPGEFVTPDDRMPGSNDRLQAILEQSRVSVKRSRYDDTALMHIGPDNTAILTNAVGWGPPRTEAHGYAELDDKHTCLWEVSRATWSPDAPWWADPDDAEPGVFWHGDS